MKFVRAVFGIAAIYGLIVLLPLYFLIGAVGRNAPPRVTHPEFYYGFIGLGLMWQLIFVLIAKDPIRYQAIMLLAVIEKFVYAIPVGILYLYGELQWSIVALSMIDPVFGILFLLSYLRTRKFEQLHQ